MKIGEDLRATVHTDLDGVTALTYRHGTKYNTIMLTAREAHGLVRALEDSRIEPMTRFDVQWDKPETTPRLAPPEFEMREIAPPDPIPELASSLTHGVPFPVGDQALWDACMADCRIANKDVVQRYADVRGITRVQAKNETFTIRYGGSPPAPTGTITGRLTNTMPGMQRVGRSTRAAVTPRPNTPPQIIKSGDPYADQVTILLNGMASSDGLWFDVDAVAGVGSRYARDTAGKLVIDDGGELKTVTVNGKFQIVWTMANND